MRPRTLHVLLLLCTVLVSGPACVGMKPVPLPPEAATSPWKYARVGDRVEYTFSSTLFDPYIPFDTQAFLEGKIREEPRGRTNTVEGRVAVEVVAVRPPWAWLAITFTNDWGRPHPHRALTQAHVLPMRMEESQPRPPVQLLGENTTEERFTAGGQTWDARRAVHDSRVSDGSLEVRVYASVPGPLYLTQGLLEASSEPAGMGVTVSSELKLRSFRQGTLEPGKVPTLEHPLGPGTWYDVVTEADREAPKLHRSCMNAEVGQLLTTTWTGAPGAAPPCGDFQGAASTSLGTALHGFIIQAATVFPWWPPVLGEFKPIRQETVTRGSHAVPVTVCAQQPGPMDAHGSTAQEVRYAVDPWGRELDGLSSLIRFTPLYDGTFHVPAQGPRRLDYSTALVDWGVWWKDAGN
ncbi:hypothetical protein D7X30_31450 [Corallococcus sp. AB011P]|uniref:DUF6068 family protein n=1 Tax=Corallococcus sp. AB011P TaxID=2316735 RepID=UPI000EA2BBD7|nr:DUF6068 family protein [Corallococcus sp. AB011P]RKG53480.1 hypothetical protein D7X30_31450 [Corallococcus sp. AB011P]